MGPNIAIIGAGPTGLTAAIELKRRGLKPTVFEARDCLGGQWAYEALPSIPVDIRDPQRRNVASAMYPKLRANLPQRAMQLCDYKLPEELKLFPDRVDILRYIEASAKAAGITPLIKFQTPVTGLEKTQNNWSITSGKTRELFTHVLVATGKDSYPNIPFIDGLERFEGSITHSQSYRTPELYRGKRVALIGACVSSEDISLDLSALAEQVYICGTFPPNGHKCYVREGRYGDGHNITQHARPERIEANSIYLQDGESLSDVDAIILCTGYIYEFPFLKSALKNIIVSGATIGPLYMNMFYPEDPTLIFLGLPRFTVHFANVHLQSLYCAMVLNGEVSLPTLRQMKQELADGGCVLEKRTSELEEYHNGVFECIKKMSELTGQPHLDWRGFLGSLNDHKRLYQQDYRQHPFDYDLPENNR
ncbi:4-hydroxyacetophenone monooxygenase [Pseudovibrio axinellae]|uniref:Trimethylamine monooxygenase n=1 Tax=Pseudovibrio axinellae TaxID=989403 RepID=A0A165VSW0_9HYPH|nr:FAD-dependent oxidoreductase [Pseudovibrio axinellae]KZL15394.1 4-hydroxyacetophenone monooxygenase [Pseudovibrio axinellae]SER54561.1 trimethylamine monooxygenase [Pseudovibrio axinellae]